MNSVFYRCQLPWGIWNFSVTQGPAWGYLFGFQCSGEKSRKDGGGKCR